MRYKFAPAIAGDSRSNESCRPLHGLMITTPLGPGADAPGFMLNACSAGSRLFGQRLGGPSILAYDELFYFFGALGRRPT